MTITSSRRVFNDLPSLHSRFHLIPPPSLDEALDFIVNLDRIPSGQHLFSTANAIHNFPHHQSALLSEYRFHAFAQQLFRNLSFPIYFSFKQFTIVNEHLSESEFAEALWERMVDSVHATYRRTDLNPGVRNLMEAFTLQFIVRTGGSLTSLDDQEEAQNFYYALLASSLNGIRSERAVVHTLRSRGLRATYGTDEHEPEDIDIFIQSTKGTLLLPVSIKTGLKFHDPSAPPALASQEIVRLRWTARRPHTAPVLYMNEKLQSKLPNDDTRTLTNFPRRQLNDALNEALHQLQDDYNSHKSVRRQQYNYRRSLLALPHNRDILI